VLPGLTSADAANPVSPKQKKPCADFRQLAETERRARFSYDDLLELFRFMEF
jgi:hypothetical protein